jgi:hypothetical protein
MLKGHRHPEILVSGLVSMTLRVLRRGATYFHIVSANRASRCARPNKYAEKPKAWQHKLAISGNH